MRPSTTAFVCLCPILFSTACGGRVVEAPPKVIEVEVPASLPPACRQLCAVPVPSGSTALDVIEQQAACIRQYEQQITECAKEKAK